MKSFILSAFCLCISFLSCFAQQSLSNPLYLGPILIDKPSVEAMAKLCKEYHLSEVPSDDDFTIFKHTDGTLIKFKFISDSNNNIQPFVEIHTTESKKNIAKVLESTGFHKENNQYEKGYHGANRFSTCQIVGNNNKRLIFTKEKGKI